MSAAPVLSIRNLSKRIKGRDLVRNISFDVLEGEVFGFLGPNGAGKTTTIRMIVGLISPTAGEVWIGGASIQKNFEQAMRNVGCIVENPELYPFLTGQENLEMFGRMLGEMPQDRLRQVVEQVELQDAIDKRVSTYSLGMRQRLGIAQALLGNPKLLILDEPTNGLDPAGIHELRTFIKRLSKNEGLAVLVSSHLLSEVEAMCDRVAIINQGELVTVATISELLEGDQQAIRLKAQPIDECEAVLKQESGVEILDKDRERIQIRLHQREISDIVAQLVKRGIQITSVESQINTLEDLFLSLTGSASSVGGASK